jgi:hypothetical protein
MSRNLPVPATRGLLATRFERQTAKELEGINAQAAVECARERAAGAIEASRVEAIADVTAHALIATAHLSATESMLITQVPHAEQRLRHIADAGAAGMANVVLGMSH